jgi:GAF domain-containing protein
LCAAQPSLDSLTYTSIGEQAQRRFGWKLFTAMRCLPSGEVERVHTSDPDAYPVAGRKPRRDTPWSRQVLVRGEPYFANDAAGIRFAFEDAEKLLGLGLGAVMNVPVKADDRVLGTLNFLREAGGYRVEQLPEALALAASAAELLR